MTSTTTIEGTQPQPYVAHEPRKMSRETDSDLYMMTEIGDGVFVAWENCRRCNVRVYDCKCAEGPQEPPFMQKWRDERFEKDLKRRPDPSFDLLPTILEWVKERGYAVALPSEVKEALQHAQVAQDAAFGDSNDTEIDALREALEFALGCLGADLPEGRDPYDEPDEEERDELHHTGKHEIDAEAEEEAHAATLDEAVDSDKVDAGLDAALAKVRESRDLSGIDVEF